MLEPQDAIKFIQLKVIQKRKAILRDAGLTGKHIAHRLGISEMMVSFVLRGIKRTAWVRHGIAILADIAYSQLWSEPAPELTQQDRERLAAAGIEVEQ